MNRNQVYYFQALWSDGSPAVDESDIKAILHAIKLDAAKLDSVEAAKHAIGVSHTYYSIYMRTTNDDNLFADIYCFLFEIGIDNVATKDVGVGQGKSDFGESTQSRCHECH
jgi:hypothetical protein